MLQVGRWPEGAQVLSFFGCTSEGPGHGSGTLSRALGGWGRVLEASGEGKAAEAGEMVESRAEGRCEQTLWRGESSCPVDYRGRTAACWPCPLVAKIT